MAISTMCLFVGIIVVLDMIITFKSYRDTQNEVETLNRELRSHIAAIKHEIASYRLSIDAKIEKAMGKPKKARRKLKSDSAAVVVKKSKKSIDKKLSKDAK